MATRKEIVSQFAREIAISDASACKLAGTEMDGEWSGEHSAALAEHLECSVRELSEDDIAWAQESYAAEAQRDH